MRILYIAVLLVLFGAVGILALENRGVTAFRYFGRDVVSPPGLLFVVIYLAGVVSGWFTIALVRRVIRESV